MTRTRHINTNCHPYKQYNNIIYLLHYFINFFFSLYLYIVPLSTFTSHFSLLSHSFPFFFQQVSSPLSPSHLSSSQNLSRRRWRQTCRSSQRSCHGWGPLVLLRTPTFFNWGRGLWVVPWVYDLSLYSNQSTVGLWFMMWFWVLWWLWIVFVYSGDDVVWITNQIIGLIWWRGAGELGLWGVEDYNGLMRWAWLTAEHGSTTCKLAWRKREADGERESEERDMEKKY